MTISRRVPEIDRFDSLKMFLEAWQSMSNTDQTVVDSAASLAAFFSKFRTLRAAVPEPKRAEVALPLDPNRLFQFCSGFRPIFAELQRQGKFIDIWSVAGLKHDELRHASVLAWFLDPTGSHGFKKKIFHAWMRKLPFPEGSGLCDPQLWMRQYRVAKEKNCPLSDGSNRLDIEIDGDGFYICMEVIAVRLSIEQIQLVRR